MLKLIINRKMLNLYMCGYKGSNQSPHGSPEKRPSLPSRVEGRGVKGVEALGGGGGGGRRVLRIY